MPVIEPKKPYKRPTALPASAYQFKPPECNKPVNVVITNAVIDGITRPHEILISGGDMEHSQWIQGLEAVISAVFKMGDSKTIIDELSDVFDPKGGFFLSPLREGDKGGLMPSMPAVIGKLIGIHCEGL